MSFVSKFAFSLVGVAGASSAVGVPLALRSVGENPNSSPKKWGGASTDNRNFDLKQCEEGGSLASQKIDYGDSSLEKVCWKAELKGGEQIVKDTFSDKYTEFFKGMGRNIGQSGQGQNFEWGMQQCENQTPGVVINTTEGVEYLGICNSNNQSKTQFIKKQLRDQEKGNVLKFGICDQDCGAEPVLKDKFQYLQQEKENNGGEVTFGNREVRPRN